MGKILREVINSYKERHPNVDINIREVVKELIKRGILYRPNGQNNSRSTEYGKRIGLFEELRELNGNTFNQVYYDKKAESFVHKILNEMYGDNYIIMEPIITTKNPPRYNYSRTRYFELLHDYPNHIILLEGPYNKIWTYYDSARIIAKLFNTEPFYNAGHEPGFTIEKEDIRILISILQKIGVCSVVEYKAEIIQYGVYKTIIVNETPENEQIITTQEETNDISAIDIVPLGEIFELVRVSDGFTVKGMLVETKNENEGNQNSNTITVYRADNTSEEIPIPDFSAVPDGVQAITIGSAMGIAITNAGYNKPFDLGGITYIVKRI